MPVVTHWSTSLVTQPKQTVRRCQQTEPQTVRQCLTAHQAAAVCDANLRRLRDLRVAHRASLWSELAEV